MHEAAGGRTDGEESGGHRWSAPSLSFSMHSSDAGRSRRFFGVKENSAERYDVASYFVESEFHRFIIRID